MNTRKLFLSLCAAFLSSAAFADEIGSGEIDPPPTTQGMTAPSSTEIENPEATGVDPTEGESLLDQLLDWIG